MKRIGEHFHGWMYAVFALVTLCVFFACVSFGSVGIPLKDTLRVITDAVRGVPSAEALKLARRPAFAEGRTYDLCYCQGEGFDPDRHFAFLRADEDETWLVVANFGPSAPVTVRIPAEAGATPQTVTWTVPERDFVAKRI